jgi:hypothetical protein
VLGAPLAHVRSIARRCDIHSAGPGNVTRSTQPMLRRAESPGGGGEGRP